MSKDITVILRCSEDEKAYWISRASRVDKKFSEWVRDILNKPDNQPTLKITGEVEKCLKVESVPVVDIYKDVVSKQLPKAYDPSISYEDHPVYVEPDTKLMSPRRIQ